LGLDAEVAFGLVAIFTLLFVFPFFLFLVSLSLFFFFFLFDLPLKKRAHLPLPYKCLPGIRLAFRCVRHVLVAVPPKACAKSTVIELKNGLKVKRGT
jgi:hypothetical protein